MSIANKPKILIAAIACRPYVQAAVACGYAVVAIDAFADVEVSDSTDAFYLIELCYGQLNMNQLMQVLNGLDLHQFVGFCYGAGFEKEPAILTKINAMLPVLGNLEQVVKLSKVPASFFALCKQLQLPHPEVAFNRPSNPVGWLRKEVGASGGAHIRPVGTLDDLQIADGTGSDKEAVYYQRFQQGKPISCLFIASHHLKHEYHVEVIGFNEQFVNPYPNAPFRYGGAVSNMAISDVAKTRFKAYVNKLSKAIGLVGLNSCDAICDGDELYLLEINPRLSATMDLYADGQLFESHIAAIDGMAIQFKQSAKGSRAQQVIYAERAVVIHDDIIWPKWVLDRPKYGSFLEQGMPVCSVVAEAETAELAKHLVNERAAKFGRELLN